MTVQNRRARALHAGVGGTALNGGMSGPRLRRYYKTLDSLSRVTLLHALQTRGPSTVEELAEAASLHPNTAREHLHQLIAVGLVRADPLLRGRRGRPTLSYRATIPAPPPPHPARSGTPAQLAALGEHLGRCGFQATVEAGAHELTLRDCPFSRLSEGNPHVCEVHRALIAAALRSTEGPLRAGELHRLVTDRECTLELTRSEAPTNEHNM
jgi:predicted ArsR family transcriptional regulator